MDRFRRNLVLWIVALFAFGIVKTESLRNERDQQRLTYIDLLEDALKAQPWTKTEEHCLNTMLGILDNAKNSTLFAVWFLDANQMPMGQLYGQRIHLGHYGECLNPDRGFQLHPEVPTTQYCLMNVTLTELEKPDKPINFILEEHDITTDVYLKKPSKHGEFLSSMQWGICVPEICQRSSAPKIAKSLLQISHFGALSDSAKIFPMHCESKATLEKASTTGPKIFMLSLLLLTTTTLFCTWYVKNGKKPLGPFDGKLIQAFCLNRNIESLTKINEEELYCINFMRIFSCIIVVAVHYFLFHNYVCFHGLEIDRMIDESGSVMDHLEIMVDTFLVLSGLLFTKGLLTDRWQNPLKFIWKRYIRLAVGFAASIVFMVTMSLHIGSGPLWHMYIGPARQPCEDHWLINILMLGNEVHANKLCNSTTWYMACDYQLCVIMTVLFVIFKKNKTFGICAFASFFAFSLIYPGVTTYVNNYPNMIFHGIRSMVESSTNVVFNSVYTKSYCRAGPFLLGGMMGYLMYTYKPKDHRKVMGKVSSHLAVVCSLIIMAAVCLFGHYYYVVDEPVSSAIYVAVNRTFWGLAVCIVIGASEYGDLPILNSIVTWYPWIPLSRLTYGIYIIHIIIFEYIFFSAQTTYTFDLFPAMVTAAGVIVFSLIASVFLWLLVEAPIININNMLLDNTWKTEAVKSNGVYNNGVKSNNNLIANGNKSYDPVTNGIKTNGTASNGTKSNGLLNNGNKTNGVLGNGNKINEIPSNGNKNNNS